MFVFRHLPRNRLTGKIPHEIGGLARLEHLSVENFAIFIILMFVFRLLTSNQLKGEIPTEIGGLASLKSLSVQYHANSPLNVWFLEIFRRTNSQGRFLARLGDKQVLNFCQSSTIQIRHLIFVFRILHGNQLTGEIPGDIGNLANLESLSVPISLIVHFLMFVFRDLSMNIITGPIPREIWGLTRLKYLRVFERVYPYV